MIKAKKMLALALELMFARKTSGEVDGSFDLS